MRFSFRPAVAFASLALLAVAAPAAASPSPGSVGIGDRLNPTLGNGGYDVLHYDLDLRYATSNPAQSLLGDETIAARATQSLSRFNLDFGGTGSRASGSTAAPRASPTRARSWSSRRAIRCARAGPSS